MQFKCPFCPRTFSSRSAYSQHKNFCIQYDPDENDPDATDEPWWLESSGNTSRTKMVENDPDELEELELNNMSLDEEFFQRIEEVRNL